MSEAMPLERVRAAIASARLCVVCIARATKLTPEEVYEIVRNTPDIRERMAHCASCRNWTFTYGVDGETSR